MNAPEQIGVVLVDHGSKRTAANELLLQVAALFKLHSSYAIVEPAHMELAEPSLQTAVDRCVAQGASRVIVHPYFLAPGRHSREDIPALAEQAAAKHANTPVSVTQPLGLHPLLIQVIEERIEESLGTKSLQSSNAMQTDLLRILDANFNRAAEGLRVVEDYLRFALNDAHLTELAKSLRHDLTAAMSRVDAAALHAARDSQGDVGAAIETTTEYTRESLADIVGANIHRAEQSLRALEEYSKPVDSTLAHTCERLRYRLYTLEKAISSTAKNTQRLVDCRLYVLLDARPSLAEFDTLALELIEGGVQAIQLRAKTLADRDLLERARLLRRITQSSGVLFIVNDRPDIAVLAQADGVHVGQEELAVSDVRALVGPDRLIGVSTHSIEQARQAVLSGADYLGVGPTFPSTTKQFDQFPGVALASAVAAEIQLPAFAIGGITAENLPQLQAAGMNRVAVSGAILQRASPTAEAQRLVAALGENS